MKQLCVAIQLRATGECFLVVLLMEKCKGNLTLSPYKKLLIAVTQVKAIELSTFQCCSLSCICKLVLTFSFSVR